MKRIEQIKIGNNVYGIQQDVNPIGIGERTLLLGTDSKNTTIFDKERTYNLNDSITNYKYIVFICCKPGRASGNNYKGYAGELSIITMTAHQVKKTCEEHSQILLWGYGTRYSGIVFSSDSSIYIIWNSDYGIHRIYGVK